VNTAEPQDANSANARDPPASATAAPAVAEPPSAAATPRTAAGRWRARLAVPAVIVAVYLVIALFGQLIAPYSATDFNTGPPLNAPSHAHPFGTDGYGRDVLSRVLVGARTILALSIGATVLGVGAGCCIGLVSGYRGGALDELLMRAVDVLLALPGLLLALLILTSLGPSAVNLVVAIAIVFIPKSARIARSIVLPLRSAGYVEAARLRGAHWPTIVFAELLPIATPELAVEFCLRFAYALLLISSLGFLGFGVQPPTPDWGLMISEARNYVSIAPWAVLFPALAIGVLVVAVNALADALASSGERRVVHYL
jgi:peptide/nickel transport system permease protein